MMSCAILLRMKTCSSCRRGLPLSAFETSARYAGGYRSQCRACRSEYAKKRKLKMKESGTTSLGFQPKLCEFCGTEFTPPSGAAKYCPDLCHYAKLRLNVVRYQNEHPEEVREWKRKHLQSPQRKQYLEDRADIIAAQARDWQRRNHESYRAYRNGYMVRRRHKQQLTLEDRRLSTAYRLAIKHDPCFYCGDPGEQDDHYFPVAKGGTDHWWNLVRACWACNNGKRAHCGTWFQLRPGVLAA